jgi:hypothetical protein
MRRGRGGLRWGSVALAALLAGCASASPTPSPSEAPSPSFPSNSTYSHLFAQVREDGSVPLETALQAFSLAIAPLPGVTLPPGDPPALYERLDGTFAIEWLTPYLDQLTADQRAVVDKQALPGPDLKPVPQKAAAVALGGFALEPRTADIVQQTYLDALADARIILNSKLGRKLPFDPGFDVYKVHIGSQVTLAQTYAIYNNKSLKLEGCNIHAEPELGLQPLDIVRATMAHELFHCYQYELFYEHGLPYEPHPQWITEGSAEWVGEATLGTTNTGRDWWTDYLTTPEQSLFLRTYDAVGFYSHMVESGIDPWTHVDNMLVAPNNVEAYKIAEAPRDDFLDTWASGLFREPLMGAAWNATADWQVFKRANRTEMALANDESKPVSAAYVAETIIHLDATQTDIVETKIGGHARLHAGSRDDVGLEQRFYCTRLDGCDCPAGQLWTGPDLVDVPPDMFIGITGSLDTASGQLIGHKLDEWCKKAPSPGPTGSGQGPPCRSGCGGSNGDPHLKTVDGTRYDLMAAGEYVLLRSPDGSIEVQARQTPRGDVATVNAAVAVRVNGHRVGFYVGTPVPEVHVDGAPIDAAAVATADLGAGAHLTAYRNGYELDVPDGTKIWALGQGSWGINLLVLPSDALRASGGGLIARIPQSFQFRVPAMPDGSTLPVPANNHERYQSLYGKLAPAWHVTQQSSLFDYAPGESTTTLDVPGFPAETNVRALSELDPNALAKAQAACAGVTDPELGENCAYDVAVTGSNEYVSLYTVTSSFQSQGVSALDQPPPVPGESPTPVPSGGLAPGLNKIADHILVAGGRTLGPDGTFYVVVAEPAPETTTGHQIALLAVDPVTGALRKRVMEAESGGGLLAVAAGSLWAGEFDTADNICRVARLDPVTLAVQANVPTVCAGISRYTLFTVLDDAIWFVDKTGADATTGAGGHLRRIDPATNAVDTSPGGNLEMPFVSDSMTVYSGSNLVFASTGKALIYGDRFHGLYRLTPGSTTFESMGVPDIGGLGLFPAGLGVWTQVDLNPQGQAELEADYSTKLGTVDLHVPFEGRLVGADEAAVYVEQSDVENVPASLWRYPIDGTAPVQIGIAASVPSQGGQQNLVYRNILEPPIIGPSSVVQLWTVPSPDDSSSSYLVLQSMPLP